MKLLVLGATGGTGQILLTEALGRGHEVIALVRAPEKITTTHDKLKVVKGDVQSKDDLVQNLPGCDAVMSCLGGRPGVFKPCDIYSGPLNAIASAMKETGVERFVTITACGTKDDPALPFIWRWVLKPTLMKNVVQDMGLMEEMLLTDQCSHINYTVVRPPRLYNTPSTGKKIQTVEGQIVTGAKSGICRQDVAIFMLDCLANNEWDRKMVAVAGPEENKT